MRFFDWLLSNKPLTAERAIVLWAFILCGTVFTFNASLWMSRNFFHLFA